MSQRIASSVCLIGALVLASCSSDGAPRAGGDRIRSAAPTIDRRPPQAGGTLTVGLDAETDGWNPTTSQWSAAGYAVATAIFDPLIIGGPDNQAHPYLAKSVTPDKTYAHWTITLRSGIKFHDGEALDAAAVVLQLTKAKASFLLGQLLGPVEKVVRVSELSLRVDMSEPWVAFPEALASQVGYIASPKQLNAPADEAARHPIGTGPYVFKEWRRDDHLTATKNTDYWQRGMPHPDLIVFKVIPDQQTRIAAFETGQIDTAGGLTPTQILQYRKDKSVNLVEAPVDTPGLIMLNTLAPPLDDARVRRALAYATNSAELLQTLGRGIGAVADGPYRPTSPWYTPSGYPTKPDLAMARSLLDEYRTAKNVKGDIKITLGCTPGAINSQLVDILSAQWARIGVTVIPHVTEQATYINDAISGHYQADCWIQFGLPDPDLDSTWWRSENAHPIGQLSLNFARNADPQIDAALREARRNPDPKVRKAAYGRVWKRFAADVPYIWTTRGETTLVYAKRVHLAQLNQPDGTEYSPPQLSGTLPLVGVWVDR